MLRKPILPTFSVNPQATDDTQKKTIKLIAQMDDSNREYVGEAFIRLIEGKKSYTTPAALSQYVKYRRKHQGTTKIEEDQVSLEEQFEDIDLGKFSSSSLSVSFEDEAIMRCDTEYMVNQFLDFRQEWYIKDGYDISRLLELALLDKDVQATWKLRWIFEENKEMDYLKYLLQNTRALEKIKTLLWNKKIILDT